jgi:hypothetical protein
MRLALYPLYSLEWIYIGVYRSYPGRDTCFEIECI